jgi:hypothetical protein
MASITDKGMIPSDDRPNGGEIAYRIYQRVFGSVFAPRFADLDEQSQKQWLEFYVDVTHAFVVADEQSQKQWLEFYVDVARKPR